MQRYEPDSKTIHCIEFQDTVQSGKNKMTIGLLSVFVEKFEEHTCISKWTLLFSDRLWQIRSSIFECEFVRLH